MSGEVRNISALTKIIHLSDGVTARSICVDDRSPPVIIDKRSTSPGGECFCPARFLNTWPSIRITFASQLPLVCRRGLRYQLRTRCRQRGVEPKARAMVTGGEQPKGPEWPFPPIHTTRRFKPHPSVEASRIFKDNEGRSGSAD